MRLRFFTIVPRDWNKMRGRFGVGLYRFQACPCCTPRPGWGLALGIVGFNVT